MGITRSGWAYGDRGRSPLGEPSDWLTVLGSAYRRPELYATQAGAERALDDAGIRHALHMNIEVAHVTEVAHGGVSGGYAYRISRVAPMANGAGN